MTAEIEESDIQEALALLKAKRENEAKKIEIENENQKVYEMFFTLLEVSHDKKIKISEFGSAITRIYSHNLVLWKEDGEFHARYYHDEEAGRLDGRYNGGIIKRYKNENERRKGTRDPLNEDNENDTCDYYGKCEVFYLNQIKECPFSGKQMANIEKTNLPYLSLRYPPYLSQMTFSKNDFYRTHKIYKRHYTCDGLSKKQYLQLFKEYDNFHRKCYDYKNASELLRKIYPEGLKNTKKYFAEKRVKKVTRNRSLTESEKTFFQMLLGANKLKSLIN